MLPFNFSLKIASDKEEIMALKFFIVVVVDQPEEVAA